jgi:hypothetical protein
MKVKIGEYPGWFGPYQLAELLCFWVKEVEDKYGMKSKPHWVHQFGEWLAYGSIDPEPNVGDITSWDRGRKLTLLNKLLVWIHSKKKRTVKVQLDRYDTWNMDSTLALIVLPMLKQLRDSAHGSGMVDLEDVPVEMRGTSHEEWDDQKTLEFYNDESDTQKTNVDVHARWAWVLDEMIFAFETKAGSLQDWEDQFHTGVSDIQWKTLENGNSEMLRGPNDTSTYDYEGRQAYQDRISNGFRLFGKYYENLWD